MAKRSVLGVMFLFVGAVLFAQQVYTINTSDGTYMGGIAYCGKNLGQQLSINVEKNKDAEVEFLRVTKLSKAQWEVVNWLLDRYAHSKGDTYALTFSDNTQYALNNLTTFIVEFTSNTQYTWWCYRPHIKW